MNPEEIEAIKVTAMLLTTEDWSSEYSKSPRQHAELIKNEAKLQVLLTKFFSEMGKNATNFINWDHYNYQVQLDYNVNVIVNDQQIEDWDGKFIKVTLKVVEDLIIAGALAGEEIYNIPLGITSTNAAIQKLGVSQVAKLVGRRVLSDGKIVKNPNTKYNIMATVRKDIAQAVKTSLGLGETVEEATQRVRRVISDISRAELIAQTESVNAYQAGLREFGRQSGAVGKEWLTAGAKDFCLDYEAEGAVPVDHTYGGGLLGPTAHPRCRCGQRLIYQKEWTAIKSGEPYIARTGITPKLA